MFRHEGTNIAVRYDGTETRVSINRWIEGSGLKTGELVQLIGVLEDALAQRRAFEAQTKKAARLKTCSANDQPKPEKRGT